MRRGWSVSLVALAACATAGDVPAALPPASFREVRSLVLVRTVEDRAGRQKAPLDGLDESLRARGYRTRIVELRRAGGPQQAALARLFSDLEARAGAARTDRFGTTPYARLGRGAAETVAALGVDAVASYHRLALVRAPVPADGA